MNPNQDPKSLLNSFLQRKLARPVTKDDTSYTAHRYPTGFQATITLNCLDGQEFAGELAADAKVAEKNAAVQALEFYRDELAVLDTPAGKNKKKRPPGAPAFQDFGTAQFGDPNIDPNDPVAMELAVQVGNELGDPAAKMARLDAATDPMMQQLLAGQSKSNKADLNTFCSKVMRRVMDKGEVAYETLACVGGFQATVRCQGLPPPSNEMVWAGEVCSKKVDAEQSAAGIAYAALQDDAELVTAFNRPQTSKTWTPNKGFGKGYDKGFKGYDKGFKGDKGFGKGYGKGYDKGYGKGYGKDYGKGGGWGAPYGYEGYYGGEACL